MFTLYGAPGWGSAISELMFELCGEPYRWVDVSGFDQPGEARDRLLALNPLGQVPTLQSEDGAVLTESAAIALMLADRHPALIPPHGDPQRARQVLRPDHHEGDDAEQQQLGGGDVEHRRSGAPQGRNGAHGCRISWRGGRLSRAAGRDRGWDRAGAAH